MRGFFLCDATQVYSIANGDTIDQLARIMQGLRVAQFLKILTGARVGFKDARAAASLPETHVMHSFYTYVAGASLLIALFSLVYARSARHYSHHCYQYVAETNETSATLKQLTQIETELTEHADSIAALHTSLHKLRSRIHMRKVNDDKKAADDGPPDPNVDPDGWKRYMNARIAQPARKE